MTDGDWIALVVLTLLGWAVAGAGCALAFVVTAVAAEVLTAALPWRYWIAATFASVFSVCVLLWLMAWRDGLL